MRFELPHAYWLIKYLFSALVSLTFLIPVALADTPSITVSQSTWAIIPPPPTIVGLISHYSALYGVSSSTVYGTLKCESNLSPTSIGDKGTSFGIAQIHLIAHPDISKAEAIDPSFAIAWTAKQFSLGRAYQWSCWKALYGDAAL